MALMAAMAIGAAGSVISGGIGYFGAQGAADKQSESAANALAFQQQAYNQTQKNEQPWIKTGAGAEYTLASLYGLPGKNGAVQHPDYSAFYGSPDYLFAKQQGLNATTNLLSAKGDLLSGGGLTGLTQFGEGLATQQYQNYVGRLLALSQMGSTAAGQAGQNAATMSNTIGGTYGQLGQAQASGIMGGANALAGGVNGVSNAYTLNAILNANKSPSSYAVNNPGAQNIGSDPYGAVTG